MTGILRRPIVTEKITGLQDKRQFSFEVAPHANKIQIALAVEKKFKVTVVSVLYDGGEGKAQDPADPPRPV